MGEVIWAPSALEDMDLIAEYIARDSPDNAALFVLRACEATDHLCEFPYSGRAIPEMCDQTCREILHGAYRIMYRVQGGDIWIAGTVHGSRDWKP